jgi:hypothetical protein
MNFKKRISFRIDIKMFVVCLDYNYYKYDNSN